MKERYDPMDTLLSFQHQASHYRRINNPKPMKELASIDLKTKHQTFSSHLNSKFEKQRKSNIVKENKRIFKDILTINQKKGLLERAEQSSLEAQHTRKNSLKNSYKVKEQLLQLNRKNRILTEKIISLKPKVGQRSQWQKHQSRNKQFNKKLKNKSPFSKEMYETDTFFKLVLDNQRSSRLNPMELLKTVNVKPQKSKSPQSRSKTTHKKRHKKLQKPNTSYAVVRNEVENEESIVSDKLIHKEQ